MSSVFEEKNISKAILRVGLPSMFGQLTTLIYNIADTYFVSVTKEPAMIAAVTLCAPVLLIIMSIAIIFGMGGSSVIARWIGENKKKEAGITLNFSFYAMMASGIVILILGLLFTRPLAQIIGADADNINYVCDYLKYVFLGAPFIMLSNGTVHLFRSAGLIKQSTIGLILGNSINIVLDFVFIVVLHWGTAGAAIASSIGFFCSSIYYMICMLREENKGNEVVLLRLKNFAPNKEMVGKVISIGIPGALITVLMSIANIVLNNYIGMYGSDAVASYGIAYKVEMIPIMLLVGLSQGVAPLIGYYYGAGQKKRMNKAMRISMADGVALAVVFTVVFFAFSGQLVSLFLQDARLIEQSGYFLRILCLASPAMGITNMVTSYFQALGEAIKSLIITVMKNALLFIPLIIILNKIWGLDGIISSQTVVEGVMMMICIIMYIYEARKYADK